eukprot:1160997-Pelagomonas_calceolata.AAC.22
MRLKAALVKVSKTVMEGRCSESEQCIDRRVEGQGAVPQGPQDAKGGQWGEMIIRSSYVQRVQQHVFREVKGDECAELECAACAAHCVHMRLVA